jgi:hypothetical protein
LSDVQAGAVDRDRISPPRTEAYYCGHIMTQSRDLSSSSFYRPSRAAANPCPYVGTIRLQPFAGALWTIFSVARIPSCHSTCAAFRHSRRRDHRQNAIQYPVGSSGSVQ